MSISITITFNDFLNKYIENGCEVYSISDIEKKFNEYLDSNFEKVILAGKYVFPQSQVIKKIDSLIYESLLKEFAERFYCEINPNIFMTNDDYEKVLDIYKMLY